MVLLVWLIELSKIKLDLNLVVIFLFIQDFIIILTGNSKLQTIKALRIIRRINKPKLVIMILVKIILKSK